MLIYLSLIKLKFNVIDIGDHFVDVNKKVEIVCFAKIKIHPQFPQNDKDDENDR